MSKTIPFLPHFDDLIRIGAKTCTARNKKYGEPGDLLVNTRADIVLRLTEVGKVRLDVVRDHYWEDEGCASPQEFEEIWNQIHPRKRFQPEQEVWLHRFVVANDVEPTE